MASKIAQLPFFANFAAFLRALRGQKLFSCLAKKSGRHADYSTETFLL
jgi:hypothetical protein